MTNTRANMSNKYWENETPIVTETDFGGISYYKNAGKIQLYSIYEKDGELYRGKGCTWDNNNMESEDAVRLVYALMQGLIDVGVESDAFSEAYSLLGEELGSDDSYDSDDENDLDEEFEDEVTDYSEMKLAELKEICVERGIKFSKRATKESLVTLLESDDNVVETVDEEDSVKKIFIGKKISYKDGKFVKVKKTTKNDYIEFGEESIEWVNYIAESASELSAMPTKTTTQKKKQDKKYEEIQNDIAEWIETWAAFDEKITLDLNEITKRLLFGKMDSTDAMLKIAAIIDSLKL